MTNRVALVQPPPTGGIAGRYLVHEPLNLIGLGTVVRDLAKAEVRIWDFMVEPYSDRELASRLASYKPDLVGFTAMTSQINGAGRLAELVKQHCPSARVVVGGQHPTALPKETLLQYSAFDAVLIGEGEQSIVPLTEGQDLADIPGIAWQKDTGEIVVGQAVRVENLDEIPIPDRDLVDRALYAKGPVVLGVDRSFVNPITVNLSRGCPFKCHFCSANIVFGNKVRFRSVENIRQELEQCKKRYSINHVSINDGLFTFKHSFALAVGELLKELGLTWDCRARADEMGADFARQFAGLGCKKVFMGTESGSQRILDLINKELTIDQIRQAFAVTREAGIIRGTQFVIGVHPSQTRDEVFQSLKLAKELDPEYCSFSIIMPLPGTPSYQTFKGQRLFVRDDWDAFNFYGALPGWRTEHFSPEQLASLQRQCMIRFYLRPGYLAKRFYREYKSGRLSYQLRSALTLARFAFEKRVGR